jgi:hypothetical protein
MEHFTRQCNYNPKHPGNHMNYWTVEKAVAFVREAGFSEAYTSGWGQSCFPPMRDTAFFDTTHPPIRFS